MPAASTRMPSGQVWDFTDNCLLIRHAGLLCGSCSSGQRFAFGFLPTVPYNTAVAVQLTLPPDGRVEDLHLQVGAPCRAHNKKGLASLANPLILLAGATGLEPATSDVTGRRSNQTELRPPYAPGNHRTSLTNLVKTPCQVNLPVFPIQTYCLDFPLKTHYR
jgi:hypothetical protein